MSLLLDTNVWLSWTLGTTRLPETTRHSIESETGKVSASIASIWEIAIKASLRKIDFPRSAGAYALRQITLNGSHSCRSKSNMSTSYRRCLITIETHSIVYSSLKPFPSE